MRFTEESDPPVLAVATLPGVRVSSLEFRVGVISKTCDYRWLRSQRRPSRTPPGSLHVPVVGHETETEVDPR